MATIKPNPKGAQRAPAAPAQDPRTSAGQNPLVPPGAPASDHDNTPTSTAGTGGGRRERKPIEDVVSVRVHTAFRLTVDDGRQFPYATGVQEMPKSHAEHWYTKHHLASDSEA